jgi:hypothetical protein
MIEATKVLALEAIYAHVMTRGDEEGRVVGVKLLIATPADVTPEEMTRTLECHEARAVLGNGDAVEGPDDPYWLPGRWIDIDTESERGDLAVVLRSDSVHDNLVLLDRARWFARRHPPADARGDAATF